MEQEKIVFGAPLTAGHRNVPRSGAAGLFSARSVAMAYLNTSETSRGPLVRALGVYSKRSPIFRRLRQRRQRTRATAARSRRTVRAGHGHTSWATQIAGSVWRHITLVAAVVVVLLAVAVWGGRAPMARRS